MWARPWVALIPVLLIACEQRNAPSEPAAAEPAALKPTPAAPKPSSEPAPEPSPIEPAPAAALEAPVADAPATAQPPAAPSEPTSARPQRLRKRGSVRVIHPQPGQTGCVEMYGECSTDDPPVCTTSAVSLECGERAKLPSTGEQLHCVCP